MMRLNTESKDYSFNGLDIHFFHWMKANKNISSFSFMPAHHPNIPRTTYPGFEPRGPKIEYRLNC